MESGQIEEANDSNDGFEMLEDCPPYLTDVGELQPETSGSQFIINSETRLDSDYQSGLAILHGYNEVSCDDH